MSFDPERLLEQTKRRMRLTEEELKELVFRLQAIFVSEPNVIPVSAPVNICGDVHGQFYDVLELFEKGGEPG